MENTHKYFALLETLKFPADKVTTVQSEEQRLKDNIELIQKITKKETHDIVEHITVALQVSELKDQLLIKETDLEHNYAVRLLYVLLLVINNTNFDSDAVEDLISLQHTKLCIQAIIDLNAHTLQRNCHRVLDRTKKLPRDSGNVKDQPVKHGKEQYAVVKVSLEFFGKVLRIHQFYLGNALATILWDYTAAICSLLLAESMGEVVLTREELEKLEEKFKFLWQHTSKPDYFRNLLLLQHNLIHYEKVLKTLSGALGYGLKSEEGFAALVTTLLEAENVAKTDHNSSADKGAFEVIANIACRAPFQFNTIKQIFEFLKQCLLNQSMQHGMGAGLLTLRGLYNLRERNRMFIKKMLLQSIRQLCAPEDLISGLIVMEQNEFAILCAMWYHIFCTSSIECLPSDILTAYLPLLLQVYYNAKDNNTQKAQLSKLIVRCLNNRTPAELAFIVGKLFTQDFDAEWYKLHERVLISRDAQNTGLVFKVAAQDHKQEFNLHLALTELLTDEQHHRLTYEIFIILLKLMVEKCQTDVKDDDLGLVSTDEDYVGYLNTKYPIKVNILLSLHTLIAHEGLKAQITENSADFLKYLRATIEQQIVANAACTNKESVNEIMLIMLTLAQEMLETQDITEFHKDFLPILKKLQKQCSNDLIQHRLDCLIALLNGELKASAAHNSSAFNKARTLIESGMPYLQVNGIDMLLDLLRRKDPVALSSNHVMIALALTTLRHPDSFAFMNCVRLFVALVSVMEAEVLDLLEGEYLNEHAAIDYRLVVGEAILKVAKELGPLCYKYKSVLLNCFMNGARASSDEFRMSAYANLAQMCRILCYQVHGFFEELLHLIDCELSTGKYIPAKRGAVLVLSELLEGMENLNDFGEMLLPIYRVLKAIEANENCDQKMRLHAANGLKTLNEKCKKLLFPEQPLEKEIKILGIKDEANDKPKGNILELN